MAADMSVEQFCLVVGLSFAPDGSDPDGKNAGSICKRSLRNV